MDKRSGTLFVPVGISSLLTIFAALCLTVFALLSLSTVRAGGALGDDAAASAAAWYAADSFAEETLSRLRGGEVPANVTETGEGRWAYTVPVDETRVLSVEVELRGSGYTVLRRQVLPAGPWQPDDDLPVWNGGDP